MKTARLFLFLFLLTFHYNIPAAVPRSGQILFSSNRSGAWRLWMIKADGSGLKQLTLQDSDDQDVDPMFSPDGKSVLFTSTRGGKAGVWRLSLEAPSRSGFAMATRRSGRLTVRKSRCAATSESSPSTSPPAPPRSSAPKIGLTVQVRLGVLTASHSRSPPAGTGAMGSLSSRSKAASRRRFMTNRAPVNPTGLRMGHAWSMRPRPTSVRLIRTVRRTG